MPIKTNGFGQMKRDIQKVADRFPDEVGSALYAEANIEMTEAKRRTPVWNPSRRVPQGHAPGTLRASGTVHEPEYQGNSVSVKLSFGGEAAAYAVIVHEDLDAFHATGEAKFLESTLNESAQYMAERVARRIDLKRVLR